MLGVIVGMILTLSFTAFIGRVVFSKFNKDLTLKSQHNDSFVQPFDDSYIINATKNLDEEWKKLSMKDIDK